MAVRLGDTAPDFTADTTEGKISFHKWLGDSWGVLFSHPKDFTPVCTTELGEAARRSSDFKKRGVKILAISVDSVDSHKKWTSDIEETQKTKMDYPIIGDESKTVANLYGMIHPKTLDSLTVRTPCIIPPAIQDPEVLKKNYPKGYTVIKPYLRTTPQPNR